MIYIVSGFESTGIHECNPLAITASVFATTSVFDDSEVVADPTEMELPDDHYPIQLGNSQSCFHCYKYISSGRFYDINVYRGNPYKKSFPIKQFSPS